MLLTEVGFFHSFPTGLYTFNLESNNAGADSHFSSNAYTRACKLKGFSPGKLRKERQDVWHYHRVAGKNCRELSTLYSHRHHCDQISHSLQSLDGHSVVVTLCFGLPAMILCTHGQYQVSGHHHIQ